MRTKDQMLKVLVIDADSDFASALGRTLLKIGHETRIVGDAKYGIVRAKAFEPDLVLVDGNIPGTSVNDLVREVKLLITGRIVVCGVSENPEDIKSAIAAGASDYVYKSVGIEAIINRVCPPESKGTNDDSDVNSEDSDASEAGDKSDSENTEEDEKTAGSKSRSIGLRAPVKEGKRPFCVVVAHSSDEKRAVLTETIERINEALRVIEVSTSEQAVAACAENRTVMLVIDWEMPDIPTKQVMRTVKETPAGKAIAMFVTYKHTSPEKQRVAEFAGALAFANEPWDDGSLEAKLKHTLDVIRKRRRTAKIQALKAKAS